MFLCISGLIFSIVGVSTKKYILNGGILDLNKSSTSTIIKVMGFLGVVMAACTLIIDVITQQSIFGELFPRMTFLGVCLPLLISIISLIVSFSVAYNSVRTDNILCFMFGYSYWFLWIAAALLIHSLLMYAVSLFCF